MIALLLAAQLAAAAPAHMPPKVTTRVVRTEAINPKNPFDVPSWCKRETLKTADRGRAAPQKLGDLPPANLDFAIDTRVNGCPVRTPVTFEGRPVRSR